MHANLCRGAKLAIDDVGRLSSPTKPAVSVRLRKDSVEMEKGSSTSDSSPWEEKAKPIPVPRKLTGNNNFVLKLLVNGGVCTAKFSFLRWNETV